MDEIVGDSSSKHSLTTLVGRGLIIHDFVGPLAVSFHTDPNGRASNAEKGTPSNEVALTASESAANSLASSSP